MEAEDDIDGALRERGMGLLNEMESAGKKLLGVCGGGRGRGECEVRRRGRHQRPTTRERAAEADQALQVREGPSANGGEGGSKTMRAGRG